MNSEKFIAEYNELKEKTKKYYNDVARSKIEHLEKTRLFYAWLSGISFFVLLLSIFTFIYFCFWVEHTNENFMVTICGEIIPIFLIIACIIFLVQGVEYKKQIKENYNFLLKPFNLKYHNSDGYVFETFNLKKLFFKHTAVKCDDKFFGNYNNVTLEIIDAKLYKINENNYNCGTNTAMFNSFKGSFVSADFNKNFLDETVIKPKLHTARINKLTIFPVIWDFLFLPFLFLIIAFAIIINVFSYDISKIFLISLFIALVGTILFHVIKFIFNKIMYSEIEKNTSKNKIFQKVNIEDVEFSKYYDIYSYDQIESRYLITSAFIERFLFLQKNFKTKNIYCAFVDGKIILLISSRKNLFEIGNLFTSLRNPKYIEKFYDEIIAILLLINHFKLNEHIQI